MACAPCLGALSQTNRRRPLCAQPARSDRPKLCTGDWRSTQSNDPQPANAAAGLSS
jgi:hypothetical protein